MACALSSRIKMRRCHGLSPAVGGSSGCPADNICGLLENRTAAAPASRARAASRAARGIYDQKGLHRQIKRAGLLFCSGDPPQDRGRTYPSAQIKTIARPSRKTKAMTKACLSMAAFKIKNSLIKRAKGAAPISASMARKRPAPQTGRPAERSFHVLHVIGAEQLPHAAGRKKRERFAQGMIERMKKGGKNPRARPSPSPAR